MKILYFHGLHGSPTGVKPTTLADAGYAVTAPRLPLHGIIEAISRNPAIETYAEYDGYEDIVRYATDGAARVMPDILVGSSFGGGLAAIVAGYLDIPFIALAPALRKHDVANRIDAESLRRNCRLIIHGIFDDVIPWTESREFCKSVGANAPMLLPDDHRLHKPESLVSMVNGVRYVDNRRFTNHE